MIIVTTESIIGEEIETTLSYVKGSSVRAKNIGRDIMAGLKNIVGGEINEYKEMMDESRKMAVAQMIIDAESKGADAVVGLRFVSSTIAQGVSEVTAYGTAVKLKK